MESVDQFIYLRSVTAKDGDTERDVSTSWLTTAATVFMRLKNRLPWLEHQVTTIRISGLVVPLPHNNTKCFIMRT